MGRRARRTLSKRASRLGEHKASGLDEGRVDLTPRTNSDALAESTAENLLLDDEGDELECGREGACEKKSAPKGGRRVGAAWLGVASLVHRHPRNEHARAHVDGKARNEG